MITPRVIVHIVVGRIAAGVPLRHKIVRIHPKLHTALVRTPVTSAVKAVTSVGTRVPAQQRHHLSAPVQHVRITVGVRMAGGLVTAESVGIRLPVRIHPKRKQPPVRVRATSAAVQAMYVRAPVHAQQVLLQRAVRVVTVLGVAVLGVVRAANAGTR